MFHSMTLHNEEGSKENNFGLGVFLGGVICVFCSLIFFSLLQVPVPSRPVVGLIEQNLASSGVSNPVTAVLLNFRSLDTLLEIAVLLIVALAVMPNKLDSTSQGFITHVKNPHRNDVLEAFLRWLLPSIVVTAGYLLWTGASLPGGAFQAGALLAGAGILLLLTGSYRVDFSCDIAQIMMVVGLVIFLIVGVGVATNSKTILDFPDKYAGALILVIEVAATLSIAMILVLLYHSLTNSESDKYASYDVDRIEKEE